MPTESELPLAAGQPALIVLYGNTARKHRALDQDLLVLGRASTCDLALTCPGVAPVHCIIFRVGETWRIRDCAGSRSPTRINGRAIQEESLRDTDVLQVGTFSFEVRLPPSRTSSSAGKMSLVRARWSARVKRLERSRRNLARLALDLRKRARKNAAGSPALAELEQHAECLRALQRQYQDLVKEYETRLAELERAEREVCDEHAAFQRESTERQTQLDQAEYDLQRRRAAEEARIQLCWEECQERCRRAEQDAAAEQFDHERALQLDRRSAELNHFARYLRRCRQQLFAQTPPVESRISQQRTIRASEVRERLSRLVRLKQELAQTKAPSAPGNQLRSSVEQEACIENAD